MNTEKHQVRFLRDGMGLCLLLSLLVLVANIAFIFSRPDSEAGMQALRMFGRDRDQLMALLDMWPHFLRLAVYILALHILAATVIQIVYACAVNSSIFRRRFAQNSRAFLWLVNFVFWGGILLANSLFYPDSVMSPGSAGDMSELGPMTGLILILVLITFITGLSLWGLHEIVIDRHGYRRVGLLTAGVATIGIAVSCLPETKRVNSGPTPPNIVLLGIDSVRGDHLEYFGARDSVMPNLDAFLNDAQVYSDVITPQARTFVALISILSGQYPVMHGARYNLVDPDLIDSENFVTHDLGENGYFRIAALDESLFANILPEYGFDAMAGPEPGAHHFLFMRYADFAMLNLVSKTPVTYKFLPQIYGNRAVAFSYDPDSFVNRFEHTLASSPADQPKFILSHLVLPHWPFRYGQFVWHEDRHRAESMSSAFGTPYSYINTLMAADAQFGQILDVLKKHLDPENTLIVAFTDHGEDFHLDRDDILHAETGRPELEFINTGHGMSAASIPQNRVFFGIQSLDATSLNPERISTPEPLANLLPRTLEIARRNWPQFAGHIPHQPALPSQPIYLESGLNLNDLLTGGGVNPTTLPQISQHYELRRDGLLMLTSDALAQLLLTKQRAVQLGDYRLIKYLDHNNRAKSRIVHIPTRKWWRTREFHDAGTAHELNAAFCDLYIHDTSLPSDLGCQDTRAPAPAPQHYSSSPAPP